MKETAPTGTRPVPSLGPAKSRAKMLCCSSCHLCGMNHFSLLHPQVICSELQLNEKKHLFSMDSQVMVALALSLVGGLSTSIGALFVILCQAPNLKMLGLLQGFAAGLMLSISFLDLAHNAINSIGFLKGNLWFFGGVVFFGIIANFIPEPTLAPSSDVKSKKKNGDHGGKDTMKKHRRQVLFSGIITAIGMTTFSVPFLNLFDWIESCLSRIAGISLHNFPEGMAVFLGSIKGLRVGLNLALAIALHNIPEGVAVALPIYFATQSQVFKIRSAAVIGVELVATMVDFLARFSKWQAFKLATVSGFAEPLGVVLVAYLFPSSLSPEILEGLLASVGGVMAFLTLHEMLPLAFDYAGQKQAVKAVFFGMAFMSASLYFLEISLPEEMSL
ncbi:hypothetical protein SADUNF_Sadunf01G0016100 [Salix dunnii]|uniref:Uncharacterized protein n=3 Tax=Salix TaxID=40685 RepID=A0A835N974_9ROSI|nr:hypothetical protein SADUNF_Sadunf01G0016100 [Salix dunnii]